MCTAKAKLRFPIQKDKTKHRLKKPESGRYHLVRLIRSDLRINRFGELFPVPPEVKLGYVVATFDVKKQKMKLFLDKTQVDEFDYKLL